MDKKVNMNASLKSSLKTSVMIVNAMVVNKEITIPELADMLDKSTRAIEMAIAKLKDSKIVARIGSDKGGYWKVKRK
jgi:ATP-dependent DNA helicase RecG